MPRELGPHTNLSALTATIVPISGLSIVDIGSGDGSFAHALAQAGAAVTGVDPFGPALPDTAAGPGRYRLLRTTAEALPLADASVDVVTFIYSLHHIPDAALPPILAEARRVLRAGGRLYIAEPLATGPLQEVHVLYHDETAVRAQAAATLATTAPSLFSSHRQLGYTTARTYPDFTAFASHPVQGMRFNPYTEAQILAPAVQQRFEAVCARVAGVFQQPVLVDLFE